MKFYRASTTKDGGNSGGYSWHTNRRDAVATLRQDYEDDPSEYDYQFSPDERIEECDITPTKAGILTALRRFGSHPDNG